MENTDDPDKYLKIIRKLVVIILIILTLASLWKLIIKQDDYGLYVILGLCLLTGELKFKRYWLRVTVVIVRIILIASTFLVVFNNHFLYKYIKVKFK